MEELKPGPLTGVTVLDFTWVLAGPFATKTLADMGAYIIKVERYKDGTNERQLPLIMENEGVTQSSYNINCNRGKKSICVDLKNPEGVKLIHEFIKKESGFTKVLPLPNNKSAMVTKSLADTSERETTHTHFTM